MTRATGLNVAGDVLDLSLAPTLVPSGADVSVVSLNLGAGSQSQTRIDGLLDIAVNRSLTLEMHLEGTVLIAQFT